MPRNRGNSCLPRHGRNCLGSVCGTNIDTEGIDFTNEKSNLVYMDKVFCFTDDTSCPLMFNLNTGGPNRNRFVTELTLEPQNCCCCCMPCTLEENAVFNIEKSFVVVEYFNTRPPGNIAANQVSIDGYPVDSVTYSNGQYLAKTASVISRIQKERCMNAGLPTKAFFLITNAGPWDIRAKYVLEGTVNTGGRTCCFRCEISNAPSAQNTELPSNSKSNFAIPDLSLPCSINGIAPDIRFQFNAGVELINPCLTLGHHHHGRGAQPGSGYDECERECETVVDSLCHHNNNNNNSMALTLTSKVAVEPIVHIEVVRQTLFCTNACEALIPCDGSELAAEEEAAEECVNPFLPDCSCGNSSNIESIQNCNCNSEEIASESTTCGNGCGCGNQWNNRCGRGCGCGCGNGIGCQQQVTACINPTNVCGVHGYNGCSW
ncbi:MAG: hypothetical protein VB095_09870 [Anaerovorax sp.]|nr:hypothetical protein [Anaerovorax sp.]